MKKLLMTLVMAFAFFGTMLAQNGTEGLYPTHWPEFDYHAFESQGSLFAFVQVDGEYLTMENYQRYEVGFYVGDECRGQDFLEAPEEGFVNYPYLNGTAVFYTTPGELVRFVLWDHETNTELTYEGTNIEIHTGEEHWEFFDFDLYGDEGNYAESVNIFFTTGGTSGYTKHIEGYTSDEDGYYLISSPVGGVSPAEVTNMVDGDFDLYKFDQNGDAEGKEWFNYRAEAFTMEAGRGYLYANAADVDLEFNGEAFVETGEFPLEYAEGKALAGYNLMGNPYAAEATVDRPFYTLNNLTNEYVGHEAGASVEAMEGILVIAEGEDESVTFTAIREGKSANAALNITRNGKLLDRAVMTFEGRNLPKVQFNANHTKVYMPVNGKDYAVAAVESFGEMPLNFKAQYNGNYTVNFNAENVEFGYLHLIDNMTGAEVDLLANPTYSFDANSSDYEGRFKLVFATSNAGNSDFAYVSNDNLIVNGEGMLQVIDMTGRVIASEQISGVSSIQLNAAAGVYVLQLNDKTQKIVVR